MGPRGDFCDYIPHPQRLEKKLKAMGILDSEGKETGKAPVVRLPMGRDYVPGKRAAEIEARRKAREERMTLAVTSEFTEKQRKIQLDARKTLKEVPNLDPEEKARLQALTTATVTDLVLSEFDAIKKTVAARLQDAGMEPAQ